MAESESETVCPYDMRTVKLGYKPLSAFFFVRI
jgi:hypothetical protein